MSEPESGLLDGAHNGVQQVCKDGVGCPGKNFDIDCIETLINLANTDFEKMCVTEIIALERFFDKSLTEIKTKLKYLEWMLMGAFSTVIVTFILSKLIG